MNIHCGLPVNASPLAASGEASRGTAAPRTVLPALKSTLAAAPVHCAMAAAMAAQAFERATAAMSGLDGLTAACAGAAVAVVCGRALLPTSPAAPTGKSWGGFAEFLSDHRTFAGQWPKIFDAYVGPSRLEPGLIEAAMVTVNSVNACTF